MPMTEFEFGWLVGILEGEGSFMFSGKFYRYPIVQLHTTDEDVMQKAVALMRGNHDLRYYAWHPTKLKKNGEPYKTQWHTRLSGQKAADFMLKILPFMSKHRTQQIREALDSWNNRDQIPRLRPLKLKSEKLSRWSGRQQEIEQELKDLGLA